MRATELLGKRRDSRKLASLRGEGFVPEPFREIDASKRPARVQFSFLSGEGDWKMVAPLARLNFSHQNRGTVRSGDENRPRPVNRLNWSVRVPSWLPRPPAMSMMIFYLSISWRLRVAVAVIGAFLYNKVFPPGNGAAPRPVRKAIKSVFTGLVKASRLEAIFSSFWHPDYAQRLLCSLSSKYSPLFMARPSGQPLTSTGNNYALPVDHSYVGDT